MDAMLFIMFDFGMNYILVFHGGLQVKIEEVQPSTFLAKLKKAEGLKDWVRRRPRRRLRGGGRGGGATAAAAAAAADTAEICGSAAAGKNFERFERKSKNLAKISNLGENLEFCLLYTSPSPRDRG